ncbi:universal stress protein [Sediminibacter sp. Hel_I_10]|uniref:universal stress protein n=1 Tax=Sediminibacter sp. Hel_I_10 TaxID=1392490 RepID=UPI00047AD1D5|nr:universal stress protein [Sediminibacter sp. Hel_I_10]
MTILLPTDFSENSYKAMHYALDFFENSTCDFYLLHVNRMLGLSPGDTMYTPSQKDIEEMYIKPSKSKLKATIATLSKKHSYNKNHKFHVVADYGVLVESIRKHVANKKIDTIVMGTKGASGLKSYILGSNTGDVIKKVKCNTLVVPELAKYKALNEIAFPTDYLLSYNIKTLQQLTDLLYATKASLRIIHMLKHNRTLSSEQIANKDLLNEYFDDFKPTFHFLSDDKVENAIQYFVENQHVDLITMVAKNLNYLQNIFFHSRVEHISYHTKIPFFVMHE